MGSNRQYRKVPLTLYDKQFRWADETLPSLSQRQQKEKKKTHRNSHIRFKISGDQSSCRSSELPSTETPAPRMPAPTTPDDTDDARDIHDDSLLANTGACFLFNLSDAVAHTVATVSGLRIGGGKLLGRLICTHVKMLTMTSAHCSCFCSA